LETIIGNRETDVEELQQAGRNWDSVIDVAGCLPRIVRLSVELLKENVGRYVFISSISVYIAILERLVLTSLIPWEGSMMKPPKRSPRRRTVR
jgi:hypothetical protein